MEEVIKTFYEAFNKLDAETMISCYHKDIVFEDPAFGVLTGERVGNMWRMLCAAQKNEPGFKVSYYDIKTEGNTGSAKWEAHYIFSKTKRSVHNKITAQFEFKDGKIIKHTDHFNLRAWAKQALGFKGFVLGGTRYFKNKLKHQTNRLLTSFESTL